MTTAQATFDSKLARRNKEIDTVINQAFRTVSDKQIAKALVDIDTYGEGRIKIPTLLVENPIAEPKTIFDYTANLLFSTPMAPFEIPSERIKSSAALKGIMDRVSAINPQAKLHIAYHCQNFLFSDVRLDLRKADPAPQNA